LVAVDSNGKNQLQAQGKKQKVGRPTDLAFGSGPAIVWVLTA
jgi:hypothetical protein